MGAQTSLSSQYHRRSWLWHIRDQDLGKGDVPPINAPPAVLSTFTFSDNEKCELAIGGRYPPDTASPLTMVILWFWFYKILTTIGLLTVAEWTGFDFGRGGSDLKSAARSPKRSLYPRNRVGKWGHPLSISPHFNNSAHAS